MSQSAKTALAPSLAPMLEEQAIASLPTPLERAQAATRLARSCVGKAAEARAAAVWVAHARLLPDRLDQLALIAAVGRALAAPAPYLKRAVVGFGREVLPLAPSSSQRYLAAQFVQWFAPDEADREFAAAILLDDAGHTGNAFEHARNIELALRHLVPASALYRTGIARWRQQVLALPDPAGYLHKPPEANWHLLEEAKALLRMIESQA